MIEVDNADSLNIKLKVNITNSLNLQLTPEKMLQNYKLQVNRINIPINISMLVTTINVFNIVKYY